MSNLANPFASILAQAAKAKPSAEIEKIVARANGIGDRILLLDCSGSMGDFVRNQRKIDMLKDALSALNLSAWSIFSFNSLVIPGICQNPIGSTNLAFAFDYLRLNENAAQILLISDGCPNSREQALSSALQLQAVISTLYIGSGSDFAAIAFMQELARRFAGQHHYQNLDDGLQRLTGAIAMLQAGR